MVPLPREGGWRDVVAGPLRDRVCCNGWTVRDAGPYEIVEIEKTRIVEDACPYSMGEHSCVTTIAEKHYLKTNKKGSAEWLSLLLLIFCC